jgi:peptidyl-prolyl cis-trans isomerase C
MIRLPFVSGRLNLKGKRMSRPLRIAALAFALSGFALPVFAADADPVVVKIDGKSILRSEVMKGMDRLGPQAAQMPPQMLLPRVVDHLVATQVVAEAGYAKGLQSSADVKDQLQSLEKELVAQAYIRQAIEPQITEDKIKERYDTSVKSYKAEDEVRARHILVKTEVEAKDIIKQLKGGADFAKLAMEKSSDTGSAKQGGDLGYFPKGEMVKAFAEAAFSMKAGELGEKAIKTEFGYHIIKVEDRRKSAAPALDAVRAQIKNQLGQEMTMKLVQDMVGKAKVERFNLEGTPVELAKQDKPQEKK